MLPVQVILPVPKEIARTADVVELNWPIVKVKLLSVIVPVVNPIEPALVHSVGLPDKDILISALLSLF